MNHTSLIPARDWLAHYSRSWLSADLIAGVTASAVILPQAMAYASLAGLPVEQGLYTALLMLPIYALLGASRVLSVTVTSPIALLTATAVAPLVAPGDASTYVRAAATLAVMVGILLALAGLLRLGFLANFISLPTLTGFKFGMGLLIASSQLGKLLGIPFQSSGFLRNIYSALEQWQYISVPTLVVSLVTVAMMLVLARWVPRLPAALVAVVFGIGVIALTDFEARGVALVSPIPPGLPSLALPDLSYMRGLLAPALGIVLMSAVESVSVGRTFARAQDPRLNTNHELFAIGVANVGAGLFQGFPGGGGTSQTAVNAQAGAKTQLSSLATMGVVILALTLFAPLFSLLPQATLGATVLVAALGLVKLNNFRRIAAVRRRDVMLAIFAALAVVLLGPLQGIMVAVMLSMLTLLYELNHPQMYVLGRKHGSTIFRDLAHHPEDETFPGLLIVHPVGRIYFANVERVNNHIFELIQSAQSPVKILLLDASSISDLEFTVLDALVRNSREMEGLGVTMWTAALNPKPLEMVQRFFLDQATQSDRIYLSVEDALDAYLRRYASGQSHDS
jgi:high affinity sulfate transporter 1